MNNIAKSFLESGLSEVEYFDLKEKKTVGLGEYLDEVHALDKEFHAAIKDQEKSIKEKFEWAQGLEFNGVQLDNGEYYHSGVNLFLTDGGRIIADSEKNKKLEVPGILRISKKVRNHIIWQEDLDKIQTELREIGEIGRKMYNGYVCTRKSISGTFNITYIPGARLDVWNDYELVTGYIEREWTPYNKPEIKNKEEKQKILTKIQLEK